MKELSDFLGGDGRQLLGKEAWSVMRRWRETFAVSVKEATGKWTIGNADWNIFSHGYFPYVGGAAASEIFASKRGDGMYVSSSGKYFTNECLVLDSLRTGTQESLQAFLSSNTQYYDLYFIDTGFNWTMIYTHDPSFYQIFAGA